ncbi:MAG: cytochrome c biogenesis protein CcsA [Verrucomicrobia bacterium]|nr:cytochrome c biogenesis protein CcsA [Verrucomicrobiota bacterium]
MDLNDARTLLWLASALYGAALIAGLSLASKERRLPSMVPFVLILFAFAGHTRGLYFRGLDVHGCPLGNGMERIQFILWSVVTGYLIMRILFRLNLLGSFAAGLAGIGGALSLLSPGLDSNYWLEPSYKRLFSGPWIELHASVAIFSYGLFALLAVVSVMYLVQQKALQAKRTGALGAHLPSIHQLETAGQCLLLVGVIFLTASIVVGSMHWTRSPASISSVKLWVTIGLWIAYCGLWYLHFRQKLYGKKFANACIALFALAILSLGFVRSAPQRQETAPQPSFEDAN